MKPIDINSNCDTNSLELGTQIKITKRFFHNKREKITHELNKSQFPLALFGANSSGRSVIALSLVSQWIKNHEGFILVNNDRLCQGITKLNKFMQKHNNTKELYILNFSNNYTEEATPQEIKELPQSSIDPINPLIGNEEIFKLLFGDSFGLLIHEIAKVEKANNSLIDYKTISSMMKFINLQNWLDKNTLTKASKTISEYLENNNEESHQQNCLQASKYIKIIEKYTEKGTFSTNPTLELKNVFINQSILHCQLPMWHTESHYNNIADLTLKDGDCFKVMDLILLQIHHVTEQLSYEYPNIKHWQNIAMLEFEYTCSNKVYDYVLGNLSTKNKWIFSGYIPHQETIHHQTIEEKNKISVIDAAQTIVLMQSNTYACELPDKLKLKLLNSVQDLPNIFYNKSKVLSEQREGRGYAMIKIYGKYELIKINLFYQQL